jgi:hypothetical protein
MVCIEICWTVWDGWEGRGKGEQWKVLNGQKCAHSGDAPKNPIEH